MRFRPLFVVIASAAVCLSCWGSFVAASKESDVEKEETFDGERYHQMRQLKSNKQRGKGGFYYYYDGYYASKASKGSKASYGYYRPPRPRPPVPAPYLPPSPVEYEPPAPLPYWPPIPSPPRPRPRPPNSKASKGSKASKATQGYPGYPGYPGYYPVSKASKLAKRIKKMKPKWDPSTPAPSPLGGIVESIAPSTLQTIVDIVNRTDELSILADLIGSPGQENVRATLSGEGAYTLFAPVNSAFDELFSTIDASALTPEELTAILQYHVLEGEFTSVDLTPGIYYSIDREVLIIDDVAITIRRELAMGRAIVINSDATVVMADIFASNGVVHLIDAVLLPPEQTIASLLAGAGTFTTLLQLLDVADLTSTFADPNAGPFTLFAPTDDAFVALGMSIEEMSSDLELLTSILTYHVSEGLIPASFLTTLPEISTLQGEFIQVDNGGTSLNGDTLITVKDLLASNGIVHVIDQVLMPPSLGIGDPGTPNGDVNSTTAVPFSTQAQDAASDTLETVKDIIV